MRRSALSLVSLVLAATLALAALPTPVSAVGLPRANYIVGYADASGHNALVTSGVTPLREHARLGIASVLITDTVAAALRTNPHISFVDANLPVYGTSSGWDSSGWDSSGWDSSGWDSSGWDSSGWDSSGWDSSGWDSSGWDSSGWDSSGWDAAHWNSSGWDSSGWDSASLSSWGAAARADGKDPLFFREWGYRAVHAQAASAAAPAATHAICELDSGVDYTHPDLAAHMWTGSDGTHGYDFVDNDADPMDPAWHGTHVAGIMSAVTGNGIGIAGASAGNPIMAVRVLNETGVGAESWIAFGIAWCVDHGASVVSMSLGTPDNNDAVARAVADALAHNVTLVAAVGNSGMCNCIQYPVDYPGVIGVAAVTPDGKPARFSTVGPDVDLAAPGVAIVSTTPGGGYQAHNGTSQATPFVSAAAAMILDKHPLLTPAQVAQILESSAVHLGPAGWNNATGWGALDMRAALAATS